MKQRRFPTLTHVWLFAAIALVAMRPLVVPIPPHDFWWHMAMGRGIVGFGFIPATDTFSYTQAGQPFYNQGWLAQVFMYGVYSLGGVPLILLVQSLVVSLAYALLLWLCIERSGAVRVSVVLLLLTLPLSYDNWNVRPQTYCLPLFAAFLLILNRWRTRGRAPLWLLPLLMVLWVNLHGSFVLGGVLMALTFAGVWGQRIIEDWRARRLQRADEATTTETDLAARPPLRSLFLWGVVTAAAMLINPRHIDVIGYVFNLLSSSSVTTLVQEWAAPTVREFTGRVFFAFVLVLVGVLTYARRNPDPIDMLLAAPFFWLALGAERNIIWFVMLVTPLLVAQTVTLLPTRQAPVSRLKREGVPAMNAVLMGIVALLVLLMLPWVKPHLGLPPQIGRLITADTPVETVTYMQADPQRPQRLFHTMGTGSYLMWAAPEQPVFIDTRIELYPYAQWQDYIALSAGGNAAALLDKYQIDGLLLHNEQQAGLLAYALDNPAWELRYTQEDEGHTYLVRRR